MRIELPGSLNMGQLAGCGFSTSATTRPVFVLTICSLAPYSTTRGICGPRDAAGCQGGYSTKPNKLTALGGMPSPIRTPIARPTERAIAADVRPTKPRNDAG